MKVAKPPAELKTVPQSVTVFRLAVNIHAQTLSETPRSQYGVERGFTEWNAQGER